MKESGKRKFGRVALYGNTNKRTRDLFLKHVFLLEEVHLTLTFYYFSLSATLNQNYGRKNKNKKGHLYVFSCGHEEHSCTQNIFQLFLNQAAKMISKKGYSSPKVSKELNTLVSYFGRRFLKQACTACRTSSLLDAILSTRLATNYSKY